jgi:hypothetical protein
MPDPNVRSRGLWGKIVIGCVIVMAVASTLLWVRAGELNDTAGAAKVAATEAKAAAVAARLEAASLHRDVLANRENGYKTRAATCTLLTGSIGAANLPPFCREGEVLAYYDPAKVPTSASGIRQRQNTLLLCELVGRPTPTCVDPSGAP